MRIVSLLPAATEWIAAFGGAGDLVGRSHECDAPTSVRALPAVTRPAFPEGKDAQAIDDAVQSQLRSGLSLYDVDLGALQALRPDLVVTQAQCEVCAASLSDLENALADWTGARPRLFSIEPATFKEVLDAALRLGRAAGRMEGAMRAIGEGERRLRALQERLGLRRGAGLEKAPTVACIEWLAPLMTAGHWTPNLVEHAGGRCVLSEKGAASQRVAWEALRAADPDVVAVLPCGFTIEETRRDLHYLTEKPGWRDLRAVRKGRVYLFDGSAYFNRPGPRLYRSIALLAAALHPGTPAAETAAAAPWEMQKLSEAGTPAR